MCVSVCLSEAYSGVLCHDVVSLSVFACLCLSVSVCVRLCPPVSVCVLLCLSVFHDFTDNPQTEKLKEYVFEFLLFFLALEISLS